MPQQGKEKTKSLHGLQHITEKQKFSCILYAHSQFLSSGSARFDLANRGVRQPVQPYTFYAQLLVFDKTLVQPDFSVVNYSDLVMSRATNFLT